MSSAQHMPDVLVIGAGPAGIAAAYALQQAGLDYLVIDRAEQIGSTWASLYPSLTLNTSRWFSHMPGAPFPRQFGIFPRGSQYHAYLLDYVGRHRFKIQLGISVQRVAPEGALWRVESSAGVWRVPVVIAATGIFGGPVLPRIEGIADFQGRLIHAHDFRDPAQVQDQRVLVVGSGPSGVDIAVAAGEVARSVHIAIRSGISLKRRYPLGLPQHAWLMLGERLPRAWCRALMRFMGRFGYRDQEHYGLPLPQGGGGITAYQGPELLDAVKAGRVQPIGAPLRFESDAVVFADGQRLSFDTVILATGYRPVLHDYLDVVMQFSEAEFTATSACDWQIGPNGERGWPLLDRSQYHNGRQVLGHPGLYIVGTFYKGKGAMYNFNVEAAIAAQQISEYLTTREQQPASP